MHSQRWALLGHAGMLPGHASFISPLRCERPLLHEEAEQVHTENLHSKLEAVELAKAKEAEVEGVQRTF